MINKYLRWGSILISIIVIAIHTIVIYPWMLDDSFISFRYAENFSLGQGLVYNLGEKVEGYTSFLWIILLALGKTIGFDIVFFSKLLGTIFSIGSIFLLVNAHRFIKNIDEKVSIVATLFLGTCGIFTPWATSGMEVTMFTFFVLLSILLYISTKQITNNKSLLLVVGAVGAISAMTRPEGILIFGIIFMDQLILTIKSKNRSVLYLAVFFVIIYLPYFIWRYSYYGDLLPNTFYGKVGSNVDQVIRGANYFMGFTLSASFLLIPALIGTFSLRWFRVYRGLGLLPLIVVVYTLYIVLVGGDCMPAFRFFTPIMPILCLISAMSILSLVKRKKITLLIVIVIALYNIAQLRINGEIYGNIKTDKVAFYGKEAGLWLKANAPPNAIIATNTAGSIPYFSKLKTIDMLGMNDKHIAHRKIPWLGKGWAGHEKGDGAYVLSRRPDYIQFGSSLGSEYPVFLSDMEIYESPIFHELYSLQVYRLASGDSLYLYENIQK
jgi:arabinofuranosyltransferase